LNREPVPPPAGRPLKIVYAGIRGAGKRTNLRVIREALEQPSLQGLVSLAGHSIGDSLMDFLLLDLTPRFSAPLRVLVLKLCPTLHREMTRDILIGGVDGVVLVVDSEVGVFPASVKAYAEVCEALAVSDAREKEPTPVLVQYNKRDLQDRLPIWYMQSELNQRRFQWVSAIAREGKGVLPVFRSIVMAAMETRDLRLKSMAGYH